MVIINRFSNHIKVYRRTFKNINANVLKIINDLEKGKYFNGVGAPSGIFSNIKNNTENLEYPAFIPKSIEKFIDIDYGDEDDPEPQFRIYHINSSIGHIDLKPYQKSGFYVDLEIYKDSDSFLDFSIPISKHQLVQFISFLLDNKFSLVTISSTKI